MNDNTKMLRAIINGQSTFRQDVLGRIDKLDAKLGGRIDGLEDRIDQVEKNLTSRIDKLGTQLAYLEDDARAPGLGFGPRLTGSEPVCLPLADPGI